MPPSAAALPRLLALVAPPSRRTSTSTAFLCSCRSRPQQQQQPSRYLHVSSASYSTLPPAKDGDIVGSPGEGRTSSSNALAPSTKVTLNTIRSLYKKGIPIVSITAHDYPTALYTESLPFSEPSPEPAESEAAAESTLAPLAPSLPSTPPPAVPRTLPLRSPPRPSSPPRIHILLVGDSLSLTSLGFTSTTSYTLPMALHHVSSVSRAQTTSYLVADLPFSLAHQSPSEALRAAAALVRAGADAVKVEGSDEWVIESVRRIVGAGIPVMGHVGLTPQREAVLGGFKVQGRTAESAEEVWEAAKRVQEAGAFSMVLEALPTPVASWITANLEVPTIGIGAGGGTSGQVLVVMDVLGGFERFQPRFAKKYAEMAKMARKAVGEYAKEVGEGSFPGKDGRYEYAMREGEWERFKEKVERGRSLTERGEGKNEKEQ